MGFIFKCSTCTIAFIACVTLAEDYNIQFNDGSYEFGYDNPDSFHRSKANRRNFVRGEFGSTNPKTGRIDVTSYTAGRRGYRPRGKNIVRKFDQDQNRLRPIGSRDDPYFDPNEDPSYSFGFKTRTHSRQEAANSLGDVTGKYSYLDDVGERHNVEYIAGKDTGFHVITPFPDSNPRAYGPLFFRGRGKPIPRGRTAIQRGLDGSYRFVSAGPDQRRTETSDASGNVRGSYTYLDDKGVQHSVHYIAGSKIGYRVLKNVKGPHLPSVFPFSSPDIIPSDFYNYLDKHSNGELFDTAASSRPNDGGYDSVAGASGMTRPGRPESRPTGGSKPSFGFGDDDDDATDDDLFGGEGSGGGSFTAKPSMSTTILKPSKAEDSDDDGFYKPEDDAGTDYGSGDDLFGGSFGSKPTSKPNPAVGSRPIGESRPAGGPRPSGNSKPGGESRPIGGSKPNGGTRPNEGSTSIGGSRPGSASGSRPSGGSFEGSGSTKPHGFRPESRPTPGFDDAAEDDDNDLNDDIGLFSGGTPTSSPKPPVISIGVTGSGGITKPGRKDDKHTIVTNLGSAVFTVLPEVSVYAHVQSIDLFPYESKVPSPSEQYNSETNNIEQKVKVSEIHSSTISSSAITTTEAS